MIESITVKKGSNLEEILFFKKIKLKQVTFLFGGNGVGKTSLIDAISKNVDIKINFDDGTKTKIFLYKNSEHNFRNISEFNPYLIKQKYEASGLSEGQSIIYSLQDLFELCDEIKNDGNSVILLDEIDSGLSLDNVEYLSDKIKHISNNYPNLQFIIAFNNFEFCRNFPEVLNMYDGNWINIENYEEYKKLLKDNRDKLLEKRKNNQFTGNVDW